MPLHQLYRHTPLSFNQLKNTLYSPACILLSSKRNFSAQAKKLTINKPTANEFELEKFRKLSNKWWSGPEFAALRNMNQLRVPFVTEAFASNLYISNSKSHDDSLPLDKIKLLDIGCGGGILSESLARIGADVTGIDPVEENISAAISHSELVFPEDSKNVPQYKCCTIEELSAELQNESAFDGIIASEVLEHVDNLEHFLKCAIHCLRPGGYFLVTTINQTPVSYLTAIFAAENILGLLPKGTHEYSKFIPPNAFSLVLSDRKCKQTKSVQTNYFLKQIFLFSIVGCDTMKVHGMFLNPLTLQWSWTQNQWVNYALMAIKRT